MPFFAASLPEHGGSSLPNYGKWNQGGIWDGSGIILTRNNEYEGTFNLNDNIAYENVLQEVAQKSEPQEKKYY